MRVHHRLVPSLLCCLTIGFLLLSSTLNAQVHPDGGHWYREVRLTHHFGQSTELGGYWGWQVRPALGVGVGVSYRSDWADPVLLTGQVRGHLGRSGRYRWYYSLQGGVGVPMAELWIPTRRGRDWSASASATIGYRTKRGVTWLVGATHTYERLEDEQDGTMGSFPDTRFSAGVAFSPTIPDESQRLTPRRLYGFLWKSVAARGLVRTPTHDARISYMGAMGAGLGIMVHPRLGVGISGSMVYPSFSPFAGSGNNNGRYFTGVGGHLLYRLGPVWGYVEGGATLDAQDHWGTVYAYHFAPRRGVAPYMHVSMIYPLWRTLCVSLSWFGTLPARGTEQIPSFDSTGRPQYRTQSGRHHFGNLSFGLLLLLRTQHEG